LLFFCYHTAGFIAGSLRQILPMRIHGKLVILDRYYYDFFVDQPRFRMAVPLRLVRLAFHFVVKPDLVFYLDVAPEIVRSRKAEVPLEETVRQREAFRALATWLPNAHIIDASRRVDSVAADIARHILGYMEARAVARKESRLAYLGSAGASVSHAHRIAGKTDRLRVVNEKVVQ
jgi:thymidylate kinase